MYFAITLARLRNPLQSVIVGILTIRNNAKESAIVRGYVNNAIRMKSGQSVVNLIQFKFMRLFN